MPSSTVSSTVASSMTGASASVATSVKARQKAGTPTPSVAGSKVSASLPARPASGSQRHTQFDAASPIEERPPLQSMPPSSMMLDRATASRNEWYTAYADEDSDAASSVSSNPTVWDNNIPRKMMDMEWNFSANPLRVADCSGKHWKRLHATYRSMIPQPGGGVLVLKQKYPHISDDELYLQVFNSGVAKPRRERKLPPLPDRGDVNTPLLKERLKQQMVAPLPKRPPPTYQAKTVVSDASSCFSVSTAAGPAGKSVVSVATKSRVSGAPAATEVRSNVSGAKPSTSVASNAVSGTSTTRSRIESIAAELRKEREERERTQDQLSEVSSTLSRVEKLLAERAASQPQA